MKVSELRIGNIVRYGANNRVLDAELFLQLLKYTTPFDPIPLTEEWLLKFGYRNKIGVRDGYGYDCGHGIMRVVKYNDTLYQYRSWSNKDRLNGFSWGKTRIDYVHQLQNLYFALTGEELTLKP